MLPIVGFLNLAPTHGFFYCLLHGSSNGISVHYHMGIDVPGSTTHGLDERLLRPEVAFLVGIEYGHQTHFWQVQSLTKEIDPHHHIVDA